MNLVLISHTHTHTHTLTHDRNRFGHLVEVRGDKYDTIIDNALPQTFIVMHIYDEVCCECTHHVVSCFHIVVAYHISTYNCTVLIQDLKQEAPYYVYI